MVRFLRAVVVPMVVVRDVSDGITVGIAANALNVNGTKRMFRWFQILALLAFGGFVSYAQVDKGGETANTLKQQKEKNEFEREQAILALKTSLFESRSVKFLRQRADIIAAASPALWNYDRSYAEEHLLSFINQSLTDYNDLLQKEKRNAEEKTALLNLDYALKQTLRALARKDMETAKSLQVKFFEIRQKSLGGNQLNESLELASEGVDFDEQRTLAFLTAILQQGIPSQFPKFIFDLKAKNPAIARILMQRAIQNLAVNPNYMASDAIHLSATVFYEPSLLVPMLQNEENADALYVFTGFIGNSGIPAEKELISSYSLNAVNTFNLRLQEPSANGFFDSRRNLVKSYFLIEKLLVYNQIYRLNNHEIASRISLQIVALMQNAGFSGQTLLDIKGYAQRLAHSNSPLVLDDGTDLFEKGENAKNPEEKLDYLIRGIIQLIESKQYLKAERKIFDIEKSGIRDALYLLVNYRAGLEAINDKEWAQFERRTEKIVEKEIKAFLYLKAISILVPRKKLDTLLSEYAIKAEKNIQSISDKTAKASAYIYLTSLLSSSNPTDASLILPFALKAVNEAPEYEQNEFEINIKIPGRQTYYAGYIGAASFKSLFSNLGRLDWNDSQIQALQLKSTGLQSIARIAAAQSTLALRTARK